MTRDEEVDAGAKALREHDMAGRITVEWECLPNGQKRKWREKSTVVLTAANAAAWRPIETARLGDVIDVMCQDTDFKTWARFCDVKLADDQAPYAFEFYEGTRIVSFKPHENGMVLTHWMPPPQPPQQEGE